jgi:hypothetical protein
MNLKNILPISNSAELLVCETDGFSLRGSVLVRNGNSITVTHHAYSETADMSEAVVDVVNQIKAKGWHGGNAILLSPAVLSTLVELPVNPKKPRSIDQMMELIRWEVEPLLMQHTTRWSVGHLLVGQGYMTAEQAEAVMDLQQGRANQAGGLELAEKFSFRRFGDLAEELGYVRRSQLSSCLAGQEWLKSDDELIECGWSGQGEVTDVPGMFNWLVTSVNQGLLKRWTDLFAKQGVNLKAMYPLMGCSASLVTEKNTDAVLIEARNGSAFAMSFKQGKVSVLNHHTDHDVNALHSIIESYHALSSAPNDSVWLASHLANSKSILTEVKAAIETEVFLLDMAPIGEHSSAGMVGAARQYWKLSGAERTVNARLGGPLPPRMQRVEFRGVALVVLLLLVILASELGLMLHRGQVEIEKADVDQRWQSIDSAIKQVDNKIAQIEKNKKELVEQEKAQLRMGSLVDFYTKDLPERRALIKGMLGILQSSTPDDVVIISLDELGKRIPVRSPPIAPNSGKDTRLEVENFNIEAWSLSEAGAQSYIQQVREALESWGMEVRDTVVQAGVGPLNMDGFTVAFRMVKLVEPDSIKLAGVK